MEVMTARDTGLFPAPKEIEMECSCPDWAVMCKHVAAVLYGVGARLDARPDLLFELRGVDQAELVKRAVAGAARLGGDAGEAMDAGKMEQVFGIEIDAAANPSADPGGSVPPAPARAARASAPAAPDRARRAAGRLKARRTRPPARNGDGRGGRPVNDRAARPAGNSAARVAENGAVASGKGSAPAAQNVALETRLPDLQRFFGEADFLTNSDYRRLFSVKVLAASRELAGLTARGVLIRSGYTRGTQYRAGPALGP